MLLLLKGKLARIQRVLDMEVGQPGFPFTDLVHARALGNFLP